MQGSVPVWPGWPRAAGTVWASIPALAAADTSQCEKVRGSLRWMPGALERKGLIVQKLFWLLQADGDGEKEFSVRDV